MNPANPQFVVVPREPTQEMLRAGAGIGFVPSGIIADIYRAMLAAAPSPDETVVERTLLIALLETQAMLETIDRTSSTNMQDVRRRIVLNRAALAAINAGDGEASRA